MLNARLLATSVPTRQTRVAGKEREDALTTRALLARARKAKTRTTKMTYLLFSFATSTSAKSAIARTLAVSTQRIRRIRVQQPQPPRMAARILISYQLTHSALHSRTKPLTMSSSSSFRPHPPWPLPPVLFSLTPRIIPRATWSRLPRPRNLTELDAGFWHNSSHDSLQFRLCRLHNLPLTQRDTAMSFLIYTTSIAYTFGTFGSHRRSETT